MDPSSPAPSSVTLTSSVDGPDVTNIAPFANPMAIEPEPARAGDSEEDPGGAAIAIDEREAGDTPPPNKKTRLQSDEGAQAPAMDDSDSPQTPGFLKLPLELLSDILIRTGSPEHVLSVARTCKSLCHTLLSVDAQFIWREARRSPGLMYEDKGVVYKLPEPPARFTEAAYAAFVFGPGKCDVCAQETSVLYSSFAIRVRLCKNRDCKMPENVTNLFRHRSPMGPRLREILPTSEVKSLKKPDLAIPTHEGFEYCNSSTLAATELEWMLHHNDPGYEAKFQNLKARNEEWMKLCAELSNWRRARIAHYHRIKLANEKLGKNIASKYGWDYKEAVTATSYGLYQSRKNKLMEEVRESDVELLKDQVEAEILSHVERVERRKAEVTLMTNRKDVETLYNQLRSKGDFKFMPSLSTFRQLPVIAMLQAAEASASASVGETLSQNDVMQKLLANQLKRWTEKAMQDLGCTLGFPKNWKNASKNILHPVERATARFLCQKCKRVDVKYRGDECLDFAGACLHECGVGNAKKGRVLKGKKGVWEASKFVKDEKAINVVKKCLEGLNFPEDKDAGNYIFSTSIAVVCTSCKPAMVVDTRNIIGHSHRHDDMQVKFESLQTIENYLGPHPYEYGVCQKLLGPTKVTPATKMEIARKNYGCRHCLREAQETQAAYAAAAAATESDPAAANAPPPAGDAMDVDESVRVDLESVVSRMRDVGLAGPVEQPPPLYIFDGLKSHLKAKHGIINIRDEDLFCYEPFDL